MKLRLGFLGSVALIVAAAFSLYQVKYRVQAIQSEIAQVKRELDTERESLNVAAAEWAYLNQPQRLQRLAERHLSLKPLDTKQIATLDAVPYPSRMVADAHPRAPSLAGPASYTIPAEGE